jgi:hypothetical protein
MRILLIDFTVTYFTLLYSFYFYNLVNLSSIYPTAPAPLQDLMNILWAIIVNFITTRIFFKYLLLQYFSIGCCLFLCFCIYRCAAFYNVMTPVFSTSLAGVWIIYSVNIGYYYMLKFLTIVLLDFVLFFITSIPDGLKLDFRVLLG